MLFYRFVWWTVAQGARALYRVKIVGEEKLPKQGAYVVAPSHRSMMEILFVALITKRRLRYMGKESVFKLPVLGTLFRWLGGFPVARDGTDRKAVRDSMAMLDAGELLTIFPEGTRQNGPKIQPLQPGAAYLALRSNVPIVPVGVAGSEEIFRSHPGKRKFNFPGFGRVVMVIGDPIVPPTRTSSTVPRADVDALTTRLWDSLQAAFDEAYRERDGV
jgi:1-acyl-sn-glycerol-3-phosphate acyltransferase